MRPVVVCSSALPFEVAEALGDRAEVRIPSRGRMSRAELVRAVADADALIALLLDPVDRELLGAAPRLRLVANCAVGYDNVDVAACTERGIAVTHTPGVLTDATADFAFALLLACARRLGEGERLVRSGQWSGWEPGQLLGQRVAGATLGIVGLGRIGRAVAARARGFSMRVLYTGPRRPQAEVAAEVEAEAGARYAELDELLSESDFVSLHCPLTPATHHLINSTALARMPRHAILVNTARGACVDEAALARALDAGQIAGAGLDVFEREPTPDPGLLRQERVVLAPHAGSATTQARRAMAEICVTAVRNLLDGGRPGPLVNPEVLG